AAVALPNSPAALVKELRTSISNGRTACCAIRAGRVFSAQLEEGRTVDGSEKYRAFYAKLICTAARLDNPHIEEAFRSVKREPFAGPGPRWMCFGAQRYVQRPDDDPAFLYQNLLVVLDRERGINIGEHSAHAIWLGACN